MRVCERNAESPSGYLGGAEQIDAMQEAAVLAMKQGPCREELMEA